MAGTSIGASGVTFPDNSVQSTAGGAVNASTVGSATAGLSNGGVGTYVYAQYQITNTGVNAGTNYTGSSLKYHGNISAVGNTGSVTGGISTTALAGTWKAMGTCPAGAGQGGSTLFLRVA